MATASSLVVMPGPSLSDRLPGVRMQLVWPQAALDHDHALAERGRSLLRPHLALSDESTTANPSLSLDRLAIDVAYALLALQGPFGREHGQAFVTQRSQALYVHHRDSAICLLVARAMNTVIAALLQQLSSEEFSQHLSRLVGEFKAHLNAFEFTESGWRKITAAEQRDIPWRRMISYDRFIQLGHCRRQVRIKDSMSESESYLATHLATYKHHASELLIRSGLPAPRNVLVTDRHTAIQAARSLGHPVVVKPAATDFGIAVSVNLTRDEDIASAFDQASRFGGVVVEQYVAGSNFRLLVMHGQFFAAVRQDPAHVVGDGIHRIDQLVENANRGRSDSLSARLKKIQIDRGVLRVLGRQGLALDSIPLAGRRVLLREHSNLSVGGTYRSVTAEVHADNKLLAERAARAIGLKVAGIDFITTDISRSYLETGGAICEVNPSPGFVMGETGYAIENAFLDPFFPEGCNGRVPLIALLGDGPMDARIAHMEDAAKKLGHRPMVATPTALRIDGRTIARGNFAQGFIVEAALQEPTATAAIVQLTHRGTTNEGLIFDRCNLAIVERREAGADDPCRTLLAGHCRTLLGLADQSGIDAALGQILGSGP